MIFHPTKLHGAFVVELSPVGDSRGWFARTWCKKEFAAINHTAEWVQMNHSYSKEKGTLRGMHFQLPPHSEIKMVRCIAGAVVDVILDLRQDSDTFLQWFSAELTAANKQMMYIPAGFAHGFQTLSADCELIYHHSAFYAPGAEGGLRYDDPALGIEWPLPVTVISDRDRHHPLIDSTFKAI